MAGSGAGHDGVELEMAGSGAGHDKMGYIEAGEVQMRTGFVYIMASKRHGTLYIGVTSNLIERIAQHKEGHGSAFVKKYNVTMLVWFEEWPLVTDAIQRETSLKRWPRKWKVALIEKTNPEWRDLYYDLF